MGKLFGTDGARGKFGSELTEEIAYRIGRAYGCLIDKTDDATFVIGRDTRSSGPALENAVAKGLHESGIDTLHCNVIPTPAVAYLIREEEAQGGVVISASHNPPEYNGIKLFDSNGCKLSDELESEIEAIVLDDTLFGKISNSKNSGTAKELTNASELYLDHAISTVEGALEGLKVVIDCGHGAAYKTTPEAFCRLGAEVIAINDDYTGNDINVDCGSTNLAILAKTVIETGADLGIAHDGDADRMLAVDESGNEIDGDYIMAICAKELKAKGLLNNNTVVTTVMANMGFDKAMKDNNVEVIKSKVGDRYVLEEMIANGSNFGGEQSGHIVFLDHNSTGDGLVTSLQLASAMTNSGHSLGKLASILTKYPQILINVPVTDKGAAEASLELSDSVSEASKRLGNKGRVLVRPSGTENLIRVMVEAESAKVAKETAEGLAKVVSKY